jgi:hypothetical protein
VPEVEQFLTEEQPRLDVVVNDHDLRRKRH